MFIRWQTRKYKRGGEAWYASLCESKRVEGKSTSFCLGYLGSIAADGIRDKDQREVFWQQAMSNLEAHNLTPEGKKQIETLIQERVSHPKEKWSALHSTGVVEWYTPPEWVKLARVVMGEIDIVPASNELAQEWIQASTYYTVADDGLAKPWYGRMWMNPPYTKVGSWTNKAIAEYDTGNLTQAILLVRPADSAAWYAPLLKRFYRATPHKRISFIDKDGDQQSSPAHGNALFYLGENVERFKDTFELTCTITKPA